MIAMAVFKRGGMTLSEARYWLLAEHSIRSNLLARDVLASLISGEDLAPEGRLWLEAHAATETLNGRRARFLLEEHFPTPLGWGDLLSRRTHDADADGVLRQLLSPNELKSLLDAHGVSHARPSMFLEGDEWEVAS